MRREVIKHTKGGAMMGRQEKFSSPDDVHDPHRLVVSRRVILRTRTPRWAAWRATAASRSRRAWRTRKSWIPPRDEAGLGVHASSGSVLVPKEILHGLDPDNAPFSGSMVDPVRNAAQRQQSTRLGGASPATGAAWSRSRAPAFRQSVLRR